MALTTEEQVLLEKYRAAQFELSCGKAVTEITSNGRTVKFGKADLGAVERLINDLEAKALGRRRRGAISFRL